jgi:hypothetical protein
MSKPIISTGAERKRLGEGLDDPRVAVKAREASELIVELGLDNYSALKFLHGFMLGSGLSLDVLVPEILAIWEEERYRDF